MVNWKNLIRSWEMSWESEPRTTGNRYLHWRLLWNQVNHYQYSWSNTASFYYCVKLRGAFMCYPPPPPQHTEFLATVQYSKTQRTRKTLLPHQKTEVMRMENSRGYVYYLILCIAALWSEKWWFFHLFYAYLLSMQVGLLRLGNELRIWAWDKGLFS